MRTIAGVLLVLGGLLVAFESQFLLNPEPDDVGYHWAVLIAWAGGAIFLAGLVALALSHRRKRN